MQVQRLIAIHLLTNVIAKFVKFPSSIVSRLDNRVYLSYSLVSFCKEMHKRVWTELNDNYRGYNLRGMNS